MYIHTHIVLREVILAPRKTIAGASTYLKKRVGNGFCPQNSLQGYLAHKKLQHPSRSTV